MKKSSFCLMGFLFCFSFFAQAAEKTSATLIQVLSDPAKYHMKNIRVMGYLHLKRDDDALYLHEEDYIHALYGNGVWIDATDDMRNHVGKLTNRYVIMEGIFDADNRGPEGVYVGTIRRIRRCEAWSSQLTPAYRNLDIVSTSGD